MDRDWSSDVCSSDLLLSQIDEQKRLANFDSFRAWMQTPATIGLVDDVLVEHAARAQGAPHLVLALLSLSIHAEHLLDPDADHDRIIRRESTRFVRKLRLALLAHATHHTTIDERSSLESPLPTSESTTKRSAMPAAESLAASFERARRFHRAWSSMDKPVTVDVLLTLLVALKAQQRERGASTARSNTDPDAEPPEEVYEQLRVLGGAQAEAQGRAFYGGQWQHTSATSLEETVRQIAQRAYWDAVSDHVANGRYDALWLVLRELQGAMKALGGCVMELDDCAFPLLTKVLVCCCIRSLILQHPHITSHAPPDHPNRQARGGIRRRRLCVPCWRQAPRPRHGAQ
jgi:hypothetical protein